MDCQNSGFTIRNFNNYKKEIYFRDLYSPPHLFPTQRVQDTNFKVFIKGLKKIKKCLCDFLGECRFGRNRNLKTY